MKLSSAEKVNPVSEYNRSTFSTPHLFVFVRCIYFLHFTQFLYQGNWTWNLKLHFWCIIKFLLKCWDFYTNMAKLNNVSSKFKSMDPQLHILVKCLHILYPAFQSHPDVFSTNYRIPYSSPIPVFVFCNLFSFSTINFSHLLLLLDSFTLPLFDILDSNFQEKQHSLHYRWHNINVKIYTLTN